MRVFKIFPKIQVATSNLSKDGLKRLAWFDYYFSHNENASLTCRYFGISRDTFYRWKKRFNKRYLHSLEDDTSNRRPKKVREMTTPKFIQKRVYEIRLADSEKSKYEIQAELKDEGIITGQTAIQKVINKYPELKNIQHKKRMKRKHRYKIVRIKAARELREKELGSLIQIDTKHFYLLGNKYYLFSAVDCKSRFGFVYAYTSISSRSAKDFIQKVRAYFPFEIQAINTDNGSEYLLEFHREIEEWNIPHFFTDPHCPKQNGRVERFHQTVEYEYLNYQNLYPDLDILREHCMVFNTKYNTKRYHRSLGYKTPMQFVILNKQQEGGKLYGM